MKSPERMTATQREPKDFKPAWSKPSIRVMTVNFTQDSSGVRQNPEDDDHPEGNNAYIPPTS